MLIFKDLAEQQRRARSKVKSSAPQLTALSVMLSLPVQCSCSFEYVARLVQMLRSLSLIFCRRDSSRAIAHDPPLQSRTDSNRRVDLSTNSALGVRVSTSRAASCFVARKRVSQSRVRNGDMLRFSELCNPCELWVTRSTFRDVSM